MPWVRADVPLPPEFEQKWNNWLMENFDPGNWDAYKDKSTQPSTWKVDAFLPDHLLDEYKTLTGYVPVLR